MVVNTYDRLFLMSMWCSLSNRDSGMWGNIDWEQQLKIDINDGIDLPNQN